MYWIYYVLYGLTICVIPFMKFPQKRISNGIIQVKLYLPDSCKGYYQGTRFDWAGNMPSLQFKEHEYFGQWFTKYSPEIHDAIMGPVEEFSPLHYLESKPGDSFLKIGVGVLSKPDDKPYTFRRPYLVLNHGKWKVKKQPNQVQFIHELNDKEYSYQYKKTVQLIKGKPEMLIDHTLRNNGNLPIETRVYNHNFFVIDNQPIGPGFLVSFPFNLTGGGRGKGELAEIDGNKIVFLRNLKSDETVMFGALEGFIDNKNDYDIRVENHNTGAGVRITCDQPLVELKFWACSTTLCPEPYIKIKVDPGQEFSWKIVYEFYTLAE
jgi:hypothetical protein